MSVLECPTNDQLKDYLMGRMSDDDSQIVENHLEACAECEQTAGRLESESDTFVEAVRAGASDHAEQPVPIATGVADDQVLQAVHSLVDVAEATSAQSIAQTIDRIGSYDLVRPLGRGGMGTVYLARHRELHKDVAIKILPKLASQREPVIARFRREMRAAGRLDHPSIVKATDAGEVDGIQYLAMEVAEGLDLGHIVRLTGPLSIADACEIMRQAAKGLAYAHQQGVIHRDVKPSNLMLDGRGQVKILDFGLAQLTYWEESAAELTSVGQLMGTLDYMAPEQVDGSTKLDCRCDVYSLGATLFKLLTAESPLSPASDLSPVEKLRLLSEHQPRGVRSVRSEVPEELASLLEEMLASDPQDRLNTAQHVSERLEHLINTLHLKSNLSTLLKRAERQARSMTEANPDASKFTAGLAVEAGGRYERKTPWWTWIALCGCAAGILGAVLITLELTKGRLVIESDVADVSVRIVNQNDASQIQELEIIPGTNTTRLRDGKYEVRIASGSDRVALEGKAFSIRRGDVQIARVIKLPKDRPIDDQAGLASTPNPTSDASDDVVYNSLSLRVWLDLLQRERSEVQLQEALNAVSAMASPKTRDAIEEPVIDFASINPLGGYEQVIGILVQATGADWIENSVEILEKLPGPSRKISFLQNTREIYRSAGETLVTLDDVKPFLEWASDTLQDSNADPRLKLAVAETLRAMLENNNAYAAYIQQEAVKVLQRATPLLSDREFWLSTVEPKVGWTREFRSLVSSRALAALSDLDLELSTSGQAPLQGAAAIVLHSMGQNGIRLDKEELERLARLVERYLQQAAQSNFSDGTFDFYSVEQNLAGHAVPVVDGYSYSMAGNPFAATNFSIALLNLVRTFELASLVQQPLEQFHGQLESKAIYEPGVAREWGRFWQTMSKRLSESSKATWQFAYFQSGQLLEKSQAELLSRFDRREPVDVDERVERLLRGLPHSPADRLKSFARDLEEVLDIRHAAEAIPVLKRTLIRQGPLAPPTKEYFVSMLSRVGQDKFFTHLVEILRAIEDPAWLYSLDFAKEPYAFACESPSSLDALLSYAGDVFASAEFSDKQKSDLASMLRSLLADRTQLLKELKPPAAPRQPAGVVSVKCQRSIIQALESFDFITNDNFWLAEPAKRPAPRFGGAILWDAPLRREMAEHALQVLARPKTNEEDPALRCRAWTVLYSVAVEDQEIFEDESLSQQAIDIASAWLKQLAMNPPETVTLVSLSPELAGYHTPRIPAFHQSYVGKLGKATASPSISLMNFIMAARLQKDLTAAIRDLHASLEELKITKSYLSAMPRVWESTFEQINSSRPSELDTFICSVLYVQTGLALDKDLEELLDHPSRVKAAEQQLLLKKRQALLKNVQPRDTLAIYIPGILPAESGDPPVIQVGDQPPVVGYPVPVSQQGMIALPFLGKLEVSGKNLEEVQKQLEQRTSGILKQDALISVAFLMRAGESAEMRTIVGPEVNRE